MTIHTAESSNGAPYNAWNINEPSNNENEDCAHMDWHKKKSGMTTSAIIPLLPVALFFANRSARKMGPQ